MKTSILNITLFLSLFCAVRPHAQPLDWSWARSSAGTGIGSKLSKSICTDAKGNLYITGSFTTPTVSFGPFTLTNTTADGAGDIFVVKYDSSGQVLWAKNIGGTNDEGGESIAADPFGNIYLAGYFFSQTVVFGPDTLISYGPTTGYLEGQEFIARLDGSGNVIWAKTTSSNNFDTEAGSTGLTTDASGNVYETGYFWSATVTFGAFTLTNAGPPGITNDLFVAKYDSSGQVLWAKSAGGNLNDITNDISLDAFGNIYITGKSASSSLAFGPTVLANFGMQDAFLAKYDAATGAEAWAVNIGGSNIDIGETVAEDPQGSVLVSGFFYSPAAAFGATMLNNPDPTTSRLFLAKYDSSGSMQWVRTAEGRNAGGQSLCMNAGNIDLLGFYADTLLLGADTLLTSYNPNGIGQYHMFVARYDSTGAISWVKGAGGANDDFGNSMASDPAGNLYLTGRFSSPSVSFGSASLSNTGAALTSEVFVAKLGSKNMTGIAASQLPEIDASLYPNPALDELNIDLGSSRRALISVLDITGKAVLPPVTAEGNRTILQTGGLAEGVYILHILDGSTKRDVQMKFVKMN